MRNLEAMGIPAGFVGEELPELSPLGVQAIACWNFCDGWEPTRWPMYGALHPVRDWYALIELMQAIRLELNRSTDDNR